VQVIPKMAKLDPDGPGPRNSMAGNCSLA
jgi:hypothetical protein